MKAYRLDGKIPVECNQTEHMCIVGEDRQVALTKARGIKVSTVFLGMDHRYGSSGPPILFETMIFSSDASLADYQTRYTTWEEAEAGHKVACDIAFSLKNICNNLIRTDVPEHHDQ